MDYRKMDEMQLEVEIRACEKVLADTDGGIVAALEGLLSCDTSTKMTNYIKGLSDEVKNLIAYRADIRTKLEAMIKARDEATPDEGEE